MYANKIKIQSDGNELTLVDIIADKVKKQKMINYKYTKSETKKGMILSLTETEYQKLLERKIATNAE
jgi:hypothetical protein